MILKLRKDKHKTIDLLPENLQKRKAFRKLMIRLAAAQVAIFLLFVLAIAGIIALEQRAWDEVHDLSLHVHTLRHGPVVTAAAYARDIIQRQAAEDALLRAHAPAAFNPYWLAAIIEAGSGDITILYYSGAGIMITGMSESIIAVETHRQSILDTGVFSDVELGRIILQDDGRYFYELRVRLR